MLTKISIYHLTSLLLGLFAWFLPVIALFWNRLGGDPRRRYLCSVLSLLACSVALCCQLLAAALLAEREDCSALLDTVPASAMLSAVLLVGTALVNLLLLCRKDRK